MRSGRAGCDAMIARNAACPIHSEIFIFPSPSREILKGIQYPSLSLREVLPSPVCPTGGTHTLPSSSCACIIDSLSASWLPVGKAGRDGRRGGDEDVDADDNDDDDDDDEVEDDREASSLVGRWRRELLVLLWLPLWPAGPALDFLRRCRPGVTSLRLPPDSWEEAHAPQHNARELGNSLLRICTNIHTQLEPTTFCPASSLRF